MGTRDLTEAFFNWTWLLYDSRLGRSALLQLTDGDGELGSLIDTSYALIYNQQEEGRTSSYFAYGDLSLDSWGGYSAYRLNNAYGQLGLSNAVDSGNIYLSLGYDNISNEQNPRLIIPTRETSTNSYLKAAYTNPKNNNGNDWPIAPIRTDTSLTSTYAFSPQLPTEIFDGYKSGVNSTGDPNYANSMETWLIPPVPELNATYLKQLKESISIWGQIDTTEGISEDVDWYIFEIADSSEVERTWTIILSDTDWHSDLDLALYDLISEDLVDASESAGSDETLYLDGLEQGIYALQVSGFEGSNSPYKINFRSKNGAHSLTADKDESNNTLKQALTIEMDGEYYERHGLTIHDENDIDYYRFTVGSTSDWDAHINLVSSEVSGDLDITLLDENGNILERSNGIDSIESISLGGLSPGTYNLQIQGFEGDTGEYSLQIKIPSKGTEPDSCEVNNSPEQATELTTYGGEAILKGLNIHSFEDIDYYKFSLSQAASWQHFVSIESNGNAGDLDLELWYINDGQTATKLDQANTLSPNEIINLNGRPGGNYLVKVYAYEQDTGGYELHLNIPDTNFRSDRFESNNTSDSSSKLSLEKPRTSLANLTLHTSNDTDWYQFTTKNRAQNEDRIQIISDTSLSHINLELYDKTGEGLIASSSSTSDKKFIPLDGLNPSDYLIKISGSQASSYTLELELPKAFFGSNAPIQPDRFEINNNPEQATDLRNISSQQHLEDLSIHNSEDQDFYRFSISGKADVNHFAKIRFDHTLGDLDLSLLRESDKLPIAVSQSVDDVETISLKGLEPGGYILKVESYGAGQGNYNLTINAPSEDTYKPDRFELNNTLSTATLLRIEEGTLQLDQLTIHTADDQDFYRFSPRADTTLAHQIVLNSSAGLQLKLLDGKGDILRDNSSDADTDQQVLRLDGLKADETYTLAISSSTPTTYGMDWRLPQSVATNNGQVAASKDDWTLMVYMTASDLDAYAFADINEMEQAVAGLRQAANIVVFLDQSFEGEVPFYATANGSQTAWHTAGYSVIQPDNDPNQIASRFEILEEQNSGDPKTLQDFIAWAAKNCPAENYGLVMWDHGGGLTGVNFDNRDNKPVDHIEINELAEVLSSVKQSGVHFEVTAFDACLMGMTELVAALAPMTDTIVASQEIIAGNGYDYTTAFLPLMRRGATPSGQDIARALIDSFTQQYVGQQADEPPADTLSAIETKEVQQLLIALNAFTEAASQINAVEKQKINALRNATQYYTESEYKDLGSFLDAIVASNTLNAGLRSKAAEAKRALEGAVLAKTPDARNSSGLSIYLPDVGQDPQRTYREDHADFISQSGWGNFLHGTPIISSGTPITVTNTWANTGNSSLRPFNLGVFSGHGHHLPANSLHADGLKQYFSFELASTGTLNDAIRVIDGVGVQLRLLQADGRTELRPAGQTIKLQGLVAGTYTLEVSANTPVNQYSLIVDAPRAIALPTIANNTPAKAQDLGLVTSQLVLPGQALNATQSNYFTFSTPRLGFVQPYQLTVSSDQDQILEVSLLRQEQTQNILVSKTGTGSLVIPYEAQGAAESYLLKVQSPAGQHQGAASVSLYFNRVDPKLAIQGQAKEGQTLTASLTGIAAAATVSYVWQEQKQNSWSDLATARSDRLFIPRNGSWTGKTVRLLATVTENGRHQDLASTPLLIASGLDSTYGVTLTPNKSSYNEGARLSIAFSSPKSLTKTAKATLYWAITPQDSEGRTDANNNLDASDFSGRSNLTGSFTLPRSATRSSVSLSLALDRRSELSESFRVELYADAARTQLLNQSALVTVIDSSNRRTATSAVDSLTGIADYSDTFVLPNLNSSRLGRPNSPTYDTIVNFESIDKIIVNGQPNGLQSSIAAALTGLTTVPVTSIKAADLNRALTPTDFPARSSRLLQVLDMGSGTFLAINNHQAGFNASTDALIYLPGYLPGLPS